MTKILSFLAISFFSTLLFSKEPLIATLNSVHSNEIQQFNIGKSNFYCRPYGIVSIEKLYLNSAFDSTCKREIKDFYLKNPQSKYFANSIFKVKQSYHIEFKENSCVIYTHGGKSYAEVLISNGLATRKILFNDKEFKGSFIKAQERAKRAKLGLWNNKIVRECIVELYK